MYTTMHSESSDSDTDSSCSCSSEDSDLWMFDSTSDDSSDTDDSYNSPPKTNYLPPVKRGRKSLADQHPDLVPTVSSFIQQHSSEAHNRRRDTTVYSHGVSLGDIQAHVQKSVPGIDYISKVTIHRLMQPARRNTQNAKRHKGLVDARVPPKRNNKTQDHVDFHSTCASVRYAHELAFMCEEEVISLSCDDKNKINVATLAVSRHFQIKRFFSETDSPNYPDHDFPYRNSKLIPSGYMVLKRKRQSRSLSPNKVSRSNLRPRTRSVSPERRQPHMFTDRTGRKRMHWPRTGPLTVYLQASPFHSSTSQTHACHLHELLLPVVTDELQSKSVVTIIADGGPDWTSRSTVNLINFGRVWRDLNMDALVLMTYAPGHSRFNPIERLWAPLSRWLTGVTLPIKLDGEEQPPFKQTSLTESARREKEEKVFDNAIEICSKYWEGKRIDTFPVSTVPVACSSTEDISKYSDHDLLKEFVDSSAKALKTKPHLKQLQEEFQFLINHCVRRKYQLEFYKCASKSCHHCVENPIRAKRFFGLLSKFGGRLPSPVVDNASSKGEFMTLTRILETPSYVPSELSTDEYCTLVGCNYVFQSNQDKKRHNTLCHPRK